MLTTPKSWLTSSHVCGHVTRATWYLKVPADRSFAVDDFRHWNFSIWSTNKGVIVILVEGYIPKKSRNCMIMGPPQNDAFLELYPSTEITITPLLVDQIEKFHCLKSSTAKVYHLVPSDPTWHVSCVHKLGLKLVNFEVYSQIKLQMKDFKNHIFIVLELVLNDFHHKIPCTFFLSDQ